MAPRLGYDVAERPLPVLDLDWDPERARSFADDVVDLWVELLGSLRTEPVVAAQLTREQVQRAVTLDVPEDPLPQRELVAHLRSILDHSLRAGHPAHLSYITGSGTVPGAAADLLASGLNPNVGGWLLSPAATEIELAVTGWLAREFGLPDTAGGLIVAGGAIANFIALKTARDVATGLDTRRSGVAGHRLAVYCS